MILLTHQSSILLAVAPADFRKQIDGLVAHCRNTLGLTPKDGTIIVFINRSRTMIRALNYDGSGYWLMTKRLSRGKFTAWPSGHEALSPACARELRMIISGECGFPQHQSGTTADNSIKGGLATGSNFATLYRNSTTFNSSPSPQA